MSAWSMGPVSGAEAAVAEAVQLDRSASLTETFFIELADLRNSAN